MHEHRSQHERTCMWSCSRAPLEVCAHPRAVQLHLTSTATQSPTRDDSMAARQHVHAELDDLRGIQQMPAISMTSRSADAQSDRVPERAAVAAANAGWCSSSSIESSSDLLGARWFLHLLRNRIWSQTRACLRARSIPARLRAVRAAAASFSSVVRWLWWTRSWCAPWWKI